MTARTVTSASEIRRASLPGGIQLEVDVDRWASETTVEVRYLGSLAALRQAGCLTPGMLAAREAYRSGDNRRLRDEHGIKFNLHRAALKSAPDRWRLTLCSLGPDQASRLPGVAQLYPAVRAAEAAVRRRALLRLVVDNTREVGP